MPELELRETSSDERIVVPPEGFIFGREGGDADVQLPDQSISRRQVRIMFRMGTWVLEIIAVPQGARAPKPKPLAEGETFKIGRTEFEVLAMRGAEGDYDESAPKTIVPQSGVHGTPGVSQPVNKAGKSHGTEAPPPRAGERSSKEFGALFTAVPKGLAYYLLNVPKLVFNPSGTLKTAIEQLPMEEMGKIELIGYALPAQLVSAFLGSIATGISTLIAGGSFSVMAFIPVVPAIIAVVLSIVIGFIFHPVLEWIIRKVFQGHSDPRSRTNFFLQTNTLSIILAVPSAVGTMLAAVRVPFIALVGPLLLALGSLVSLYVVFKWFTAAFDVAKWVRIALLVLGALAVVGASVGLVTGLIANVRGLGSGSGGTVAGAGAAKDVEKALADAEKVREQAEATAKQVAEKGEEPPRDARAAAKEAKGKSEAAAKEPLAHAEAQTAAEHEKPSQAPEKTDQRAVHPEPATEQPEKPAVKESVAAAPPPPPPRTTGYPEFARLRALLEKQLALDPTLLEGRELQDLYGSYAETSYEIDKRWRKEMSKHPERTQLYEHLREAELYKKTGSAVEKLSRKLGIR